MKHLIILLLFVTNIKAQNTLNFNKRFVESEDKWVAFQMDKDSTYAFGFIYIDSQAGLTLDHGGKFRINNTGTFIPIKQDSFKLKVRLEPNNVKVAFIPNNKFDDLLIKEIPDWLKFYKEDTATVERYYRWGYLYNAWDECAKALTFLEKGQKINPKFKGLEFELAYAYNALQQYEKAIPILESAIESSSDDCYLYKELSFAEMHIGELEKASQSCKRGILACTDKALKSEIAHNLSYQYYKKKDKINFKYWSDETKKWATKGDQFMTNIKKMEDDLYR
jgi:tetratricopeptide (TPR) repeat protein